jgi:hypothetical protein
MQNRMFVMAVVMIAALVAVLPAASTVAGTWTMTVEGSPHGNTTMGLTLKQDGARVSGTFNSPHGDMPIDGEFVDGHLKMATTGSNDDEKILFDAKLTDGGTLAGYLSSPMGDMKWTASRAAAKDGK